MLSFTIIDDSDSTTTDHRRRIYSQRATFLLLTLYLRSLLKPMTSLVSNKARRAIQNQNVAFVLCKPPLFLLSRCLVPACAMYHKKPRGLWAASRGITHILRCGSC